ncbi:MAG: beta-lactamase family protein [Defluviitaleaceae bacterium]|nr:beta-lactamase family protein [Defluviitaleaceae bacterium]
MTLEADMIIGDIFREWNKDDAFSGVFSASGPDGAVFQSARGFRNRAEKLPNEPDTAFAIASGTKLFTALAACKLIEERRMALGDRVRDLLPFNLGLINDNVTVFHLLTHTSGIGDYIDEEASGEYLDILKLYDGRPVHKWDTLAYYLPMFRDLPAKFKPGERFGYSNAGFILLGLAIESVSGTEYHRYIKENIIDPLGLAHTGFYRTNVLPGNTALGYRYDEALQQYVTNVLYMPVIGGSDGGIFTCAGDLIKLWRAVFDDRLFSAAMRGQMFAPRVKINEMTSCGLGVFLKDESGKKACYTVGGDFGADFFSAYFPEKKVIASALGNTEMNTFPLFRRLFEALG